MSLKKIVFRHWIASLLFLISIGIMLVYAYLNYWQPKSPEIQQSINSEKENALDASKEIPQENNEKKIKTNNSETKKTSGQISETLIQNSETKNPETIPQDKKSQDENLGAATIAINGSEYAVTLAPSSSVYDALQELQKSGTVQFDFKEFSGLGYFVDGINGQKSDTLRGKYWIYYINGAKAQIGISQYILKSNDIITWKYENQE